MSGKFKPAAAVVLIALMAALAACDPEPTPTAIPEPTATTAPTASTPAPTPAKVMEVMVGPELLDCVGVGPQKCMEVNGDFFYGSIDGFEHEEGYNYRLKIERYDAFPGEKEPPQDASRYGYRLIEVISKTAG